MNIYEPLKLAETADIAQRRVPLRELPKGYVLRKHLGLVTHAGLDGQVVHRTDKPVVFGVSGLILETRAIKTPGGDYLLMFAEGEHYGGHPGHVNDLIAYRSRDRGKTWEGPTVAFDIDYSQHGFCPLIPKGTKRIYSFGTQPVIGMHTTERGQGENAPIGYRYSDDDGHHWCEVRLIRPENDPDFRAMFVMRPCETDAGTWLITPHEGDYSHKPMMSRQYVIRSADQGKTWTLLPGPRHGGWFLPQWNRMDEGRAINLGGGKVLLLARTLEGHIWAIRSEDDGQTWSDPAPTPLVHPDAPPMPFHLSDGKTLIVFHHNRATDRTYKSFGTHNDGMADRAEVWFSTSIDGARTFSEPRFLFSNAAYPDRPGHWYNSQCSYLDMFIDDGVLNIFCPHRWQQALHLQIRETDLLSCATHHQVVD
jgi:hypothetical protein